MKLDDVLLFDDYRNEFGPPDDYWGTPPDDDEFKPLDEVVAELGIEPEIWDMMVQRVVRDNNREGVSFKHNIVTLAELLEDGVYHEDNYELVYNTLGEYDYDQHDDPEYRSRYIQHIEKAINKLIDDEIVGDSPDELRKNW